MPRYRLTIEYNGEPYRGWQRQDDVTTVQGAIESSLVRLGESDTSIYGAGRTDSGVHALGQVAHVDLSKDWDTFRLGEAINGQLQESRDSIAITDCQLVDSEFHARFSATKRHYLYRLIVRRPPLVMESGRAWHLKRPIDISAMQSATKILLGQHDFTTFRSSECQSKSPIKTLETLSVEQVDDIIEFRTSALSFLHHQVRSIVGAIKFVGEGRWSNEDLRIALESKDRSRCPALAPSHGLYLVKVEY